jgi:hypothetical protein
MIDNKSLSKYLLFAFGEITHVMIDILLVLRVNNCNNDRKDVKRERDILLKLREGLLVDAFWLDCRQHSKSNNLVHSDYKDVPNPIATPDVPMCALNRKPPSGF